MQDLIKQHADFLKKHLEQYSFQGKPDELYSPIRYMLSLGGKRIRPILCLMSCELFGGAKIEAINPALSIEVFHNFTLVHDDIMDEAPLRRGKATVHEKWNRDIAILSGDVMFVKAYEILAQSSSAKLPTLLKLFNSTAIEVCEGQQMDMNFEEQNTVEISDYLKMIELKTAVLLACSLKMGAIVANATDNEAEAIYSFGKNLGIAFQLQDDYLDSFGNQANVGKRIGGDILSNKKTYLMLSAIEKANEAQLAILEKAIEEQSEEEKIAMVMGVFRETKADEDCLSAIQSFHQKAMAALDQIDKPQASKQVLRDLAEGLLHRNN